MSNSSQDLLVPPAATVEDELALQQGELLRSLLVTVQHFFGGFERMFENVLDPRHPAFVTYPLASVLTTGLLMFLFRLGARRQVNLMLRQNGPSSAKFGALFGVEACPHGDTLDKTYRRLNVAEVAAVVTGSVETLIRRKVLYPYRLRDRYFPVAIDGTGVLTFPQRHCPHCLTVTHNGRTTYHPVLEAKAARTPSPSSAVWKPNRILRRRSRPPASSGSPTSPSRSSMCSNYPKEVVCDGRLKTHVFFIAGERLQKHQRGTQVHRLISAVVPSVTCAPARSARASWPRWRCTCKSPGR